MRRLIPIGVDDFRKLREQGMEYVDKSHLIQEVLDRGAEVLLLPRPVDGGRGLQHDSPRYIYPTTKQDALAYLDRLREVIIAMDDFECFPEGAHGVVAAALLIERGWSRPDAADLGQEHQGLELVLHETLSLLADDLSRSPR